MTKSPWVCFPCRRVARSATARTCPRCRAPMSRMSPQWRPPRKTDEAAWRARSPLRTPTVGDQLVNDLCSGVDSRARAAFETAWDHPDEQIRLAAAEADVAPVAGLARLLRDASAAVRARALAHPALAAPTAVPYVRAAARDKSALVRATAASHPQCPPGLLGRLLNDPAKAVREAAAANPGARGKDLSRTDLALVPAARLGDIWDHACRQEPEQVALRPAAVRLLTAMQETAVTASATVAGGRGLCAAEAVLTVRAVLS